jgi:hypothetical protein
MHEQVVRPLGRDAIRQSFTDRRVRALEHPNCLSRLLIQRHQPFLFRFPRRDAQARRAIGIVVETVHRQTPNFVPTRPTPPGNQKCGPLERTR